MVYAGRVVVAVFVHLVAVTVYGNAGHAQLIHYYLVRGREAAANRLALYKPAVSRVYVGCGDIILVVLVFVRRIIVCDVFRKILVYLPCKENVLFGIRIGSLSLFNLVDYCVDLAVERLNRLGNLGFGGQTVIAVKISLASAVDKSGILAVCSARAYGHFVKIYVEKLGVVGKERVARRAERLGNGKVAVLYPRLDLVGRNYRLLGNAVMNLAVLEVARSVNIFKCFVELLSKSILSVRSVF